MDSWEVIRLDRIYIATSPNYWGRGSTVEEAKANLKNEGGTLSKHIVFVAPEGAEAAWVDGLGGIHWRFPEDYTGELPGHLEEVSRRGVPKDA